MWDMEGEDFSEPGEGWSVVTVGSLGTLGGVSQGVYWVSHYVDG